MSHIVQSGKFDLDVEELKVEEVGDRMTLSVGPHHPSTHGVLRVVLEIEGERIIKAAPEIGFLHTGIEKNVEDLTWTQAITLVDRMDYLAPLSNDLGYVLAVEKLLGIEVPERARTLRILFAELTRMASHSIWLGTTGLDIGAMSIIMYAFDLREGILDLIEEASGVRMNPSYFRIGGLAYDIPEGFVEQVTAYLDEFPARLAEIRDILDKNPIWLDRMKGVGVINAEDAIALGVTGPNLRASGIPYDVRKAYPYAGYEDYDFDVPVTENGDCYDRYIVRMLEMMESHRICRQALARLTDGPVEADDRKVIMPPKDELHHSMEALIHHFKIASYGFDVPEGHVYQAIESPRGELGFYIVSNGTNRPWRMRVRGPAFYNVFAMPTMMEDSLLADMVAVIASVDPVFGEVDR